MLSQTTDLLLTPFLTGFVGYGTNWLAIKMLFRPHRRSIWSFGWQGVIPKNRAKLAKEIGELVGEKLLRKDDIAGAFFSEAVQRRLEKAVEHELRVFLEKDYGSLNDIISRSGYRPETVLNVLFTALNKQGAVDRFFAEAAESVRQSIYSLKIGSLAQYGDNFAEALHSLLSSQKIQEETGSAISSSINNFVMSGKSLADLIPSGIMEKIPALSGFLTDKILESLENAFDDAETREKIAAKLVDLKNGHFSDGMFDKMKLGFLNMFLNEDTIKDIVNKYMPTLIKSVKDSETVKQKIKTSLATYIETTARKPLYQHADAVGMENLFSLRAHVVSAVQRAMGSKNLSDGIAARLSDYLKNNPDKTLGDVLTASGLDSFISDSISSSVKADIPKLVTMTVKMTESVQLNNIYAYIPKKVFAKIKTGMIRQINKIVEKNIEKIIDSVDFPKITEKRINSLDLYEVESLLFSFMNDSFKWINILGFVLGFIFGAAQSLIIFFG